MNKGSVIQEWVQELSFMQQSVLISAIRGPDGIPKFHQCKPLLKWYRRCVLFSAFDGMALTDPRGGGGGSFTGPSTVDMVGTWETAMDEVVDAYIQSQDLLPHHFQAHFMHAVEIIGYKHPDKRIRDWWHCVYVRIVHTLHLWPETEDQMDKRLGDNKDQWLARSDKAATCSD